MSDVKLFGVSLSSYVRGVCAALHEKGVAFEHVQHPPNSEAQLAVHPYGKVPAFAHGEVVLFESLAIMDYIDRVFDGPALSPADAAGRGKMMQWLSGFNSYMYGDLAAVVIPRLIHGPQGQPVDEDAVAASAAKVRGHLEILDKALAQSAYLAGEQCTLADLNAVPLIQYFTLTPEAEKGLAGLDNVGRWLAAVLARPAMQKATTQPSAAS